MRESNPRQKFWRLLYCHYTNPANKLKVHKAIKSIKQEVKKTFNFMDFTNFQLSFTLFLCEEYAFRRICRIFSIPADFSEFSYFYENNNSLFCTPCTLILSCCLGTYLNFRFQIFDFRFIFKNQTNL